MCPASPPAQMIVFMLSRGNCPRSDDHPIIVLEPDGSFVRSFGDGSIKFAHQIAVGVDGLLYCVDVGGHLVRVFTVEGEFIRTIAGQLSPSDTSYTTDLPNNVPGRGPVQY